MLPVKSLSSVLAKNKLAAAVFVSYASFQDPNVTYFSRVPATVVSPLVLVVFQRKRPVLLCSRLDVSVVKSYCPSAIQVVPLKRGVSLLRSLSSLLRRGSRIGINPQAISFAHIKFLRKHFRFSDISKDLERVRQIKSRYEIACIRTACAIASEIMLSAFPRLRGSTEAEIAHFLKFSAFDKGLDLAFEPIVASAGNASNPHHRPGNSLIKGFCIIDFGVKYRNYCSDITRTPFIGKPSLKQRDLYDKVLDAQKISISNLRTGVPAGRVHDSAVTSLGPLAERFIHKIGHSVGVQVHDPSSVVLESICKSPLESGMVFTVEPGVYMPGVLGIRIEDTICVGKSPKLLTSVPKNLVIL